MNNDNYVVWDEFDTKEYAWRSYGRKLLEIDHRAIEGAMRALEGLGLQPGTLQYAADVGAGPNLYPSMLLAPFMMPKEQGGQLDLIEISAPNRRYLETVLASQDSEPPLIHIWDKYQDVMAAHSPLWRHSLSTLQGVATVVNGDIYALPATTYDAVVSFFVAESITDSHQQCETAINNLIAATKPGGVVMVAHMLESSGWHAGYGNKQFPAVPLTTDDIREIYNDKLTDMTVIPCYGDGQIRDDDHGFVVVIGKRPVAVAEVPATSETDKQFTYYDTQSCLYDEQRVAYLKHAIFATVKPGDVVVDGGSGTGLLGLLAVQAGAAKVYCVELNPECARIITQNAKNNGMADKIIVLAADATTVDLPESVDVIIGEVISCGFFYEPQLQIVANLKRFLKPGGAIIPMAMEHCVELIDAQEELYGLTLNYDARYYPLSDLSLTTKAKYLDTDFYQETPFDINERVTVRSMVPGKANAVKITYNIQFSDSTLASQPTDFLLIPQIIYLAEPIWLKQGAYYDVALQYRASASPLAARIQVQQTC